MIGERGATLSGGQKQRLSLARAVVKNAPVVINRILIIIAHRLSTIRHAHWIYVLGPDGALAEAGTYHDLLESNGLYTSLWRLQIGETSS